MNFKNIRIQSCTRSNWQICDRVGERFKKKCGFGDQIHWFLEVDRRQIRLISLSDFKKYFGSGQTRPKNNLMYLIM